MLTPPVGRGSVGQRFAVGAFSLGSILGGVFTATWVWLLSGLAAAVTGPAQAATLATVGLVGLLRDFGLLSFPLPARKAQVPKEIFERGLAPAALQFGFEMGTGLRTYMTTTAPYVLVGVLMFSHVDFVLAVACGAGFGAARALVPVLRLLSRSGDSWDGRLAGRSRLVARGSAVAGFVTALLVAVFTLIS